MNAPSRKLRKDVFENSQQVTEYIDALTKRVLPFKFAYIGPAAYTHDELVRSVEYALADTEAQIIKSKFSAKILPNLRGTKILVVDIGSGNGVKASLLLSILIEEYRSVQYVALDYSETLIGIAKNQIKANLPTVEIDILLVDFESISFKKQLAKYHNYDSRIFLFLGQTLGNPANRKKTLENIRDSMQKEDYLLVGIELYKPERIGEILEHYNNEPFYKAIFNPLTYAGFTRDDGKIEVIFNKIKRDIEVFFRLSKDVYVEVEADKLLSFSKGEKIKIGLSHRFDEDELMMSLESIGLRSLETVLNNNSSYALILAQVI